MVYALQIWIISLWYITVTINYICASLKMVYGDFKREIYVQAMVLGVLNFQTNPCNRGPTIELPNQGFRRSEGWTTTSISANQWLSWYLHHQSVLAVALRSAASHTEPNSTYVRKQPCCGCTTTVQMYILDCKYYIICLQPEHEDLWGAKATAIFCLLFFSAHSSVVQQFNRRRQRA